MDLRAATYQNTTPLTYRLKTYVSEVSEFTGDRLGSDVVELSDIKGRALHLGIPKGSLTTTQQDAIGAVRSWARKLRNPVEIIITEL
jgi:hypothetical protein